MKTRKNTYFKVIALAAIAIAFAMPAKAQLSDNGFANIDWQFNAPLSNDFANKASGWGMNFEGGYFVTDNSTNHKYIGRETFAYGSGTVTTDQQHTMFQLPFGATARYQWNRGGDVQPYVSVKLGAEYAKLRTNSQMLEVRDETWGFYASPEVGVNVFPWVYGPGLHFSVYYSYATNNSKVIHYKQDGLNNLGFRLGVSF